ncbi:hypothetical protein DRN44_06990 [Thermococci archaeon]|nr:MAG: hypothetical protein DRN44_06990 [Thermococci archaeon]
MINLKKLFRRKKGQGALEYLFMIAAALIIIFVVVRYISSSGQQATQQGDIAALQSQAELAKSNLQAKNLWNDNWKVTANNTESSVINIQDSKVLYSVNLTGTTYGSEVETAIESGNYGSKTFDQLYDMCIQENDETGCKILITLGESKWIEK